MAAVWITRFLNATDKDIGIMSSDETWRPWVNGRRLVRSEVMLLQKRLGPNAPTVVDASYWFVGWTDFADTTFIDPYSGQVFFTAHVGPKDPAGNDWLKLYDVNENQIAAVEVGPRGPGWVASVDFHVTFDEGDKEVRWNYWNANGIGANILKRIDEQFTKSASDIGKALFKAIFG